MCNMFSRKCDKRIGYYIFCIMNYVVKICLKIYSRILKVTLSELCWTFVVIVTVFVICTWNIRTVQESAKNPVILWWTSSFPGTSETKFCSDQIKCDVFSNRSIRNIYEIQAYLFYASDINFDDLPLPRHAKEIIWGLYHEESPRNVEEMMHEEIISLFNYSSTFSRLSDVPFPLQHLDSLEDITNLKYFVSTAEKNTNVIDIAPIMYLQTDCETSTERDDYVKQLMNFINIDSYGACLNNKEMPKKFTQDYLNNLNEEEFLRFIARYKFVISIENGVCDDYVTEKFWRAIKVGTVPIYFGSPSIRDWFPNNKSAILLQDYPSPKLMSDFIYKLLNNDTLYEEYLEHKIKKIVTNRKLLEEMELRPYQTDPLKVAETFECYICKKLHEKKSKFIKENVINKKHYNCPKPISALSLQVNPSNPWVHSFETVKRNVKEIRKKIMSYQ